MKANFNVVKTALIAVFFSAMAMTVHAQTAGGLTPKLQATIIKYLGPEQQDWGSYDGIVSVYFIDPNRFDAFKAELDAGGEYSQTSNSTEKDRKWDRGKASARFIVIPKNGEIRLDLNKADNSRVEYKYKKLTSAAIGTKLQESLGKYYAGPKQEIWNNDGIVRNVYYIDPARFNEFIAELDAGGEYRQSDNWTNKSRDWNKGALFARIVVPQNAVSAANSAANSAVPAETTAEQLAASLNAMNSGSAKVSKNTVTLSKDAVVQKNLTVPEGVTLTITGKSVLSLRNMTLTVNGTVEAPSNRIVVDSNWAIINGSGTIKLVGKGALLTIGSSSVGIETGLYKADNSEVVYKYFPLSASKKLTLDGVTLIGTKGNNDSLVSVSGTGELVLKSGTITGNNSTHDGAGVYIKGTFTMEGGTISDNSISSTSNGGGGVCTDGGTFTMNGGTISGNTTKENGGGVGLWNNATFTMNGGTISGNTADGKGGGIRLYNIKTFTMNGGEISGNTAKGDGGGLNQLGGTFIMNGGTIYGSNAGDKSNKGGAGAAVVNDSTATTKFGTGGTYTKGGASQTGGSNIGTTNDTLIAIPAKK